MDADLCGLLNKQSYLLTSGSLKIQACRSFLKFALSFRIGRCLTKAGGIMIPKSQSKRESAILSIKNTDISEAFLYVWTQACYSIGA